MCITVASFVIDHHEDFAGSIQIDIKHLRNGAPVSSGFARKPARTFMITCIERGWM